MSVEGRRLGQLPVHFFPSSNTAKGNFIFLHSYEWEGSPIRSTPCSLIFSIEQNSVAGARTGADPAYSWPTPGDNGVRGSLHSLGHWVSFLLMSHTKHNTNMMPV